MKSKKKILLIDDEEDFCFFVGENLEKIGHYNVITATNGKDGIDIAKIEKPDLILLDLMMPRISGADVAATLMEDPNTSGIPIIFLTAMVSKEEMGKGTLKEIAGRKFIAKPVNTAELVAAIDSVLK